MPERETPAQTRRRLAREEHERRERELDQASVDAIVATMPPLTEDECLEFRELLRPVRAAASSERRAVA